MAKVFIDSSSVHSAIGALLLGKQAIWGGWEGAPLLNTTYLLLQDNARVVPGLTKGFRGLSGNYAEVAKAFPTLEQRLKKKRILARDETAEWLNRAPHELQEAWNRLLSRTEYPVWVTHQRQLFWPDHLRMYGCLFEEDLIPTIAHVLHCSQSELSSAYNATLQMPLVSKWSKSESLRGDAQLVEQAWMVNSLIRGKFHERLSRIAKLQLSPHPFRRVIQEPLLAAETENVPNSQDFFCKILIGSALREVSGRRRVARWIRNVKAAREAIEAKRIPLPPTTTQDDAERLAAEAARACGVRTTPKFVSTVLDFAVSSGLGVVVGMTISPWVALAGAFVSPALRGAYSYFSGEVPGEQLAKIAFETRSQFRRLSLAVPGRVEVKNTQLDAG